MSNNPLQQLAALGQSLWLDDIGRKLIVSGRLRRLIVKDGLRGMTSNPAIFARAIEDHRDYDGDIRALAMQGKGAVAIYEAISRRDVQRAANEFRPRYDQTGGTDGYVSVEVNPHLAHDTGGTAKEARRLWAVLKRPNVLIKVPATLEGLPAIRQLISEGINVNATLLFGLPRYRQVAEAFISGLEARVDHGQPLRRVVSVASFFVSRMDALVDARLEPIIARGGPAAALAETVRGRVAIANAKLAYQIYREIFGSDRFRDLMSRGAHAQRLLWASTGTKHPADPEVKYVEALIGPETVTTLPLATLTAYRDQGRPEARLEQGLEAARLVLAQLPELGISLDQVARQLETEGIDQFIRPFDRLLATLGEKCPRALLKAA